MQAIKEQVPGAERLLFAGKDLHDTSTLSACGIPKEATVDVLGRLFGGGRGSGGGASKSKKGVAEGTDATDASARQYSNKNAIVAGTSSSLSARHQTTTSDADARLAKDCEIAALQRRIEELELPTHTALHRSPQPETNLTTVALKLQVDKLELQIREQNLTLVELTEKRNHTHAQMRAHTVLDPSSQSPARCPAVGQETVGDLKIAALQPRIDEFELLAHAASNSFSHLQANPLPAVGQGTTATSKAECAVLRDAFGRFADCNLSSDTSQHRLSKDALTAALAALNVERAEYEIEDLLTRFDLNSDGEVNFEEFRIMFNANPDVEKVLRSLAIEDIIAAFIPKGSADDALSEFFGMNKDKVKAAVVASVDPITELIWAAIQKMAKAMAAQTHHGRGGGKMGGPLKGGKIEEFYQVRGHSCMQRLFIRTLGSNMRIVCSHTPERIMRICAAPLPRTVVYEGRDPPDLKLFVTHIVSVTCSLIWGGYGE